MALWFIANLKTLKKFFNFQIQISWRWEGLLECCRSFYAGTQRVIRVDIRMPDAPMYNVYIGVAHLVSWAQYWHYGPQNRWGWTPRVSGGPVKFLKKLHQFWSFFDSIKDFHFFRNVQLLCIRCTIGSQTASGIRISTLKLLQDHTFAIKKIRSNC